MQKQVSTIDPNRVRAARESAGLTKVQLANFLQVEPRTINTYENDGAPAKHADSLAAATGRPQSFFTGSPFELISLDDVYFRSAKKVSKKSKYESTSLGAIGMEFFEHFVKPYQLPQVGVPTFDNTEPQMAAQQLRILWGLGEHPLPNLVQLFESRGIRVLSLPKVAEKLDAFSHWYPDGQPYIFLKTSKTAERMRFDLAHELGHLVMHSRGSYLAERDVEKEADRFASEFLMPARAIRAEMPRSAGLDSIFSLKKKFRVSAMAMNYRGGELDILTEWGQRQNYVSLNKLGYKMGEPDGYKPDSSRVIPYIVADMREKGKSIAALAATVGVTMQEVNGFTFGEVMAPVKSVATSVEKSPAGRPALRVL
ncbi:ImmA/IrrE family metallo-endopeptidase [Rothia nasimurium]|uniref:ImmA/IrrE family metallo-endopeptidase n=2 Tax=Rothia nasimurium TaxID=85336 RepID=A0A4Y9F4X0_9MICC|nr:ImmA/IrrE family metallo-endopeptidase [Rothia nasimurium]